MLRKYKSVVVVLDMKVVTILTEITTKLESFLPIFFLKNDFYSNKADRAKAILRGAGVAKLALSPSCRL
jgi:prophage DNA circulation protein